MLLLVNTAWADAIMPGPMVCPPAMTHVIKNHAEVCAFDPMTAVIQGTVVCVLGAAVIGIALFVKR